MSSLTGNTAIDVAIGLSFVYLLFSVLCSAVQEGIAAVLDWRSQTLEAGLRNLLDDDGKAGTRGASAAVSLPAGTPVQVAAPAPGSEKPVPLTDQLLGHGLIRTLYKSSLGPFKTRRGPSYIPSRTFALALLDIVVPSTGNDPIADVRKTIADSALVPDGTKSALLSLAGGAIRDRNELRGEIEQWFDGAMSRVSGWYKRRTQIVICVLSLIVAIGLNVNSVSIADRLINDAGVRAALVQSATSTAAKPGETVSTVAGQIQSLGLPIGWDKRPGDPARVSVTHWGRAVGGWLITFLALSLGAPFWFGALSKITGLRATGPPPKTASPTSGSGG